ncbi:MRC [Mytilus coruscus]|uniref:MRC n=1 Tax=Mytilus coruscus TaxID=42192 RepID=A0A6J8CQY1_MYTCO|nr:MRC [Mytilus coruscus]
MEQFTFDLIYILRTDKFGEYQEVSLVEKVKMQTGRYFSSELLRLRNLALTDLESDIDTYNCIDAGAGNINKNGFMRPTCLSYGGALVKLDTHEKQTYISDALEGRTKSRVAIQGHSFNSSAVWTYEDGTSLAYTNWRSDAPKTGQWYLQIFDNDEWTEQNNSRPELSSFFIWEIE